MRFGWPVNQAFETQPSQVVSHLAGRVVLVGHAEQIDHQGAQVPIVEAVDQMLEQGKSHQQGHHTRLAKLQGRRLFTVLSDGRLHHTLDAVAAQAAVVADAFDFQ